LLKLGFSLSPSVWEIGRMGRVAKTCLRSLLKLVNSFMGIAGIAMILYSLWMLRVWQRDMDRPSDFDVDSKGPW
jgi:hypothetical protein